MEDITRAVGADIVVLENGTLFDSCKFNDMNTEDDKLGSLLEENVSFKYSRCLYQRNCSANN